MAAGGLTRRSAGPCTTRTKCVATKCRHSATRPLMRAILLAPIRLRDARRLPGACWWGMPVQYGRRLCQRSRCLRVPRRYLRVRRPVHQHGALLRVESDRRSRLRNQRGVRPRRVRVRRRLLECGGQCIHTSHCCPTGGGAACPANEHCTSPGVCECLAPFFECEGQCIHESHCCEATGEGACEFCGHSVGANGGCKGACTSAGFTGKQCNPICGNGQFVGACPVGQGGDNPCCNPGYCNPDNFSRGEDGNPVFTGSACV